MNEHAEAGSSASEAEAEADMSMLNGSEEELLDAMSDAMKTFLQAPHPLGSKPQAASRHVLQNTECISDQTAAGQRPRGSGSENVPNALLHSPYSSQLL